MSLYDLLTESPTLNITINAGQLIEVIDYAVNKRQEVFEQRVKENESEKYLSPKETTELLKVSKSTLWRYNKTGYLKTIEIGGKRRYRLSEVKRLLNGEE